MKKLVTSSFLTLIMSSAALASSLVCHQPPSGPYDQRVSNLKVELTKGNSNNKAFIELNMSGIEVNDLARSVGLIDGQYMRLKIIRSEECQMKETKKTWGFYGDRVSVTLKDSLNCLKGNNNRIQFESIDGEVKSIKGEIQLSVTRPGIDLYGGMFAVADLKLTENNREHKIEIEFTRDECSFNY